MTTTTLRRKGEADVPTAASNGHAAPQATGVATVPDPKYFTEYIGRKIHGVPDFVVLEQANIHAMNVLLEGPTGPGKTSFVLAYAAREKRPFYSVSSNVGVEPSQLFGKFVPDNGNGWVWVDGGVTSIVRHGGVLLLNELNFLPERIATVLFGLLDKRREIVLLDHKGEVIRAHKPPLSEKGPTYRDTEAPPCWCPDGAKCPPERAVLIVADMNPDYEGTRPLNKALRNRFPIQIDWDYDRDVESRLVRSTVLLDLAYRFRALDNIETPVATNMLQEFERLAGLGPFGLDFAIANFCQHFMTDERPSIQEVFRVEHQRLLEDLAPPEQFNDGYGGVFHESKSAWSRPFRAS